MLNDIVDRTGTTFEQNLLGMRGIDTVDPVNIEAILSKQFTGQQLATLGSSECANNEQTSA